MIDWWQALLLVFGGGLAGLPTAYFVHRWATTASRQGEERQAIRQLRRERMQPVLDFLDMAKQAAGRESLKRGLDMAHESAAPEHRLSSDEFERKKREMLAGEPDALQERLRFGRAGMTASMAGISVHGLIAELAAITVTLFVDEDPQRFERLGDALKTAEQLVEQYLAGAEPQAT